MLFRSEDDIKSSLSMQSGLNQFQGLDEIQYAGGDRILLFADRIYLYELTGKKVIAETEYPDRNGGEIGRASCRERV